VRAGVWNRLTSAHAALYRASGGRIGGSYRGAPVLLLHHLGRRSRRERVSPLIYLRDGADLVIVASNGGSHRHPMWWLNLREMPETAVEVGGQRQRVAVRQASSGEKAKLWPRLVEMYPSYADYQARSSRDIPVIRLSRPEST
jgi:deazaflavin-dependent oxidoreductase (nitroreductase family)